MKQKRKRNFVEAAMHYRQIVILCTACLVAFGVYSLPQMSCRCCALAVLEDTGILESKWFKNDNTDGKAALYSHILELSVQSDRFDDKTLYLLDLAAKCLEPFVTGKISYKRHISIAKPSEFFKNLFDDEI